MKATITSIQLRGPLKFFKLIKGAMKIDHQLKTTNCKEFKKSGFWTKQYTMTLWESEEEMKAFAYSGAHLEVMKSTKEIAKEVRSITIDATELPSWKEAKKLLEGGKVIRY